MGDIKSDLKKLQLEAYDLIASDIKHQVGFISDAYRFDIEYFESTLNKLKNIQQLILSLDTSDVSKSIEKVGSMSELDLSILKYYKVGKEMSGFEIGSPWESLYKNGYLNGDLELTNKGCDFIRNYSDWDNVEVFNNEIYIRINYNQKHYDNT